MSATGTAVVGGTCRDPFMQNDGCHDFDAKVSYSVAGCGKREGTPIRSIALIRPNMDEASTKPPPSCSDPSLASMASPYAAGHRKYIAPQAFPRGSSQPVAMADAAAIRRCRSAALLTNADRIS
jgi:hypothetical protein